MIKGILSILSLSTILLVLGVQEPVRAGEASCVIKGASNEILFRDQCNFEQFSGNGSFSITAKSGLIAGKEVIKVYILKPGVAQVRGLTTTGINSMWGDARRSNSDRACWVGDDFSICVY